ncbi:hypothetical protein SJI19_06670 [Acerihabitans sp. TG2]|uniref:hypothetical protein n=1 Tax=Acerihabitans sp. TG2 TaxID=3096008 RepID=UPI002B2325B2|nr:hypothetical protein [Acerihabitans sp. TG2]MEA9390235.1 hypothetical protein [Acerihabitans sp. TG2]
MLVSPGGCDPQVKGHVAANLNVGNDRDAAKVADRVKRYPDTFRADILDVTDVAAIHALVERVFAQLKRIDVITSEPYCRTIDRALPTKV